MLFAILLLAAQVAPPSPGTPSVEPRGRLEAAYPFPSPDGATIVFQGNFDGRWQLYAMNGADGTVRRVHVSTNDDTHPSFSPDGSRIAFISNRDGNDEVYILDLASGEARVVAAHPGKDGHPRWSADGQWLIFNRTFDPRDRGGDGDSAILRVRPDGSGLEVLSDSPRVETFPSFSPDGRSIVFVEWFPDQAGARNRNGELVIVDIATGARRNLTNSPAFDGQPYWGASGRWIYFSTGVATQAGREALVHRISSDGTRIERLTPIDGRSEARPVPTRDERALYFNTVVEGHTLIYRMPIAN